MLAAPPGFLAALANKLHLATQAAKYAATTSINVVTEETDEYPAEPGDVGVNAIFGGKSMYTDSSNDASRVKGNDKRNTIQRARSSHMVLLPPSLGERGTEVCPTMRPSKKLGKRFLVDTVATVSTITPLKDDHGFPSDDRTALVATNSSPITCYWMRTLEISIMGRNYSWPFLIADVKWAFLGADFLAHHELLVDVHHKRLVHQGTYLSHHLSSGQSLPTVSSVPPHKYGGPLQVLRLLLLDIPQKESWGNFPASNRQHFVGPSLLRCLRRRHPRVLQDSRRTPGAHEDGSEVVRFDKCSFGAEKVEFLWHELLKRGVCPVMAKVGSIKNFLMPTSIKSLQKFTGTVNYYQRFLPNVADVMTHLLNVLKGKPKKLQMSPPQQETFSQTMIALCKATTLAYYDPWVPLMLIMDASNIACCAVLEQVIKDVPQPLAFFSKTLKPPETGYSTFYPSDPRFHEVWGCVAHRQQGHLAVISQFDCTISYIPGRKNPMADARSKISINSIHIGVDYEDIAQEQTAD
ncbi:uncharacterized protein [Palaemon carinicauda]|uniref:uncharacterized protein n=1 Tax=Palaemon carinicauda TaxID=392227 RepID=UPI0035B674E5